MLGCFGGTPGTTNQHSGEWSNNKVTCGPGELRRHNHPIDRSIHPSIHLPIHQYPPARTHAHNCSRARSSMHTHALACTLMPVPPSPHRFAVHVVYPIYIHAHACPCMPTHASRFGLHVVGQCSRGQLSFCSCLLCVRPACLPYRNS